MVVRLPLKLPGCYWAIRRTGCLTGMDIAKGARVHDDPFIFMNIRNKLEHGIELHPEGGQLFCPFRHGAEEQVSDRFLDDFVLSHLSGHRLSILRCNRHCGLSFVVRSGGASSRQRWQKAP